MAGNNTTQCGTNGAPCDDCSLKSPPTTCNPSTFICGDTTPSCTGCTSGCCDNGNCVLYGAQSNARCGTAGAICQACTLGPCDLTNGTCVNSNTDTYKTCVVSVTFNCNNYEDCREDPDPLLYVSSAVEGEDLYDQSTRQSFTVTDASQTLTLDWCAPDLDGLGDILRGVKLQIWEEDDTWSPFDLNDNMLASCTITPAQSIVTSGTPMVSDCGSLSVTLRFEP